MGAAISLATGQAPETAPRFSRPASVRFLTAPPGKIITISGFEEASNLPGIEQATLYVAPGDRIRQLTDATGRIGHIIAAAENKEAVEEAMSKALSCLSIEFE